MPLISFQIVPRVKYKTLFFPLFFSLLAGACGEGMEAEQDDVQPLTEPLFTLQTNGKNTLYEYGGTLKVDITSNYRPNKPVHITVQSSNTKKMSVSPYELIFDKENWSQAQTVTIHPVDNDLTDGPVEAQLIVDPASSEDKRFHEYDPEDLSLTVWDDDTAGIQLSTSQVVLDGTPAELLVSLPHQPLSPVSLGLTPFANSNYQIDHSRLNIASTDWFQPRLVTLTNLGTQQYCYKREWLLIEADNSNTAYGYQNNRGFTATYVPVILDNIQNGTIGTRAAPLPYSANQLANGRLLGARCTYIQINDLTPNARYRLSLSSAGSIKVFQDQFLNIACSNNTSGQCDFRTADDKLWLLADIGDQQDIQIKLETLGTEPAFEAEGLGSAIQLALNKTVVGQVNVGQSHYRVTLPAKHAIGVKLNQAKDHTILAAYRDDEFQIPICQDRGAALATKDRFCRFDNVEELEVHIAVQGHAARQWLGSDYQLTVNSGPGPQGSHKQPYALTASNNQIDHKASVGVTSSVYTFQNLNPGTTYQLLVNAENFSPNDQVDIYLVELLDEQQESPLCQRELLPNDQTQECTFVVGDRKLHLHVLGDKTELGANFRLRVIPAAL